MLDGHGSVRASLLQDADGATWCARVAQGVIPLASPAPQ